MAGQTHLPSLQLMAPPWPLAFAAVALGLFAALLMTFPMQLMVILPIQTVPSIWSLVISPFRRSPHFHARVGHSILASHSHDKSGSLKGSTPELLFFHQRLFPSLDYSAAFALAKKDANAVAAEGPNDFLYGEITFDSLAHALISARPPSGGFFLDLGSGCGKAVFTAALTLPIAECRGVELLPGLHAEAQRALEIYEQQVSAWFKGRHMPKVRLELGDMLYTDAWQDVDFVYCFATAMSQQTVQEIQLRLEDMKPGAQALIVSRRLQSPLLIEEAVFDLEMAHTRQTFPAFLYRHL